MMWHNYFTDPGSFDPSELWPLAWKKFTETYCLFDFFDAEKVFITVKANYGYGSEPESWSFDIDGDHEADHEYPEGWTPYGETREEAEHKAFIDAFHTLERRLRVLPQINALAQS